MRDRENFGAHRRDNVVQQKGQQHESRHERNQCHLVVKRSDVPSEFQISWRLASVANIKMVNLCGRNSAFAVESLNINGGLICCSQIKNIGGTWHLGDGNSGRQFKPLVRLHQHPFDLLPIEIDKDFLTTKCISICVSLGARGNFNCFGFGPKELFAVRRKLPRCRKPL